MRVVGVPPSIDEATFVRLLREGNSPAAPEGKESYAAVAALGVDPLFALATFWHESRFGTAGIVREYDLKNPGATRSSRTGVGSPVAVPGRGQFWRYPSWTEGFRDLAYRLVDPTFVYAKRGATTVEAIIPLWAPASDGNRPEAYIRAVYSFMGRRRQALWQSLVQELALEDRRSLLAQNPSGGPGATQWPKEGVVIHYYGPEVSQATDSGAVWKRIEQAALYHTRKDWGGGTGAYGDGLMYHIVVGPKGERWLCRDLDRVLWHCGSWPENASFFSILVPIGGQQRATPEQLASLSSLVEGLCRALSIPREKVVGHQELSPTSCPGTLMQDFVLPFRNKGETVAEGRFFPETGHFVGHGFWRFWLEHGGLPIFGYPISGEFREVCEDGVERTVQYFERAVFEWHEDKPGKPVLLRRLGALVAKAKGMTGPGIS
ncbi:MAG: N-acetylmuramoyl-L-alanine amidase [Candidatus Caldarchaeum sp.]